MGIKKYIFKILDSFNLEPKHKNKFVDEDGLLLDLEDNFKVAYKKCAPYSMTGIERMYAAYKSVEYVLRANIPGDIVECGVWRGGSSMIMAIKLLEEGDMTRKIFMYDTFEGMSEPRLNDKSIFGESAMGIWKSKKRKDINDWCLASLEDVKQNMLLTKYPLDRINFVKGKVEETIPNLMPGSIAVLRLDTDWFESTYHELRYLFPLLSKGGILILDDYGHWEGAKGATEKYFKEKNIQIFLNRIDYTGRIAIK